MNEALTVPSQPVSLRDAFVARRDQVPDLGMVALHCRGQHGATCLIQSSVDMQPIAPIACLPAPTARAIPSRPVPPCSIRSRAARASLLVAVAISGCLVPEKFVASVWMKPDGAYTYKFDGTASHVLAAMAIKKQGSLSTKEEAALKQDADKTAKTNGVRRFNYLGNGHYDISIERELKPGQNSDVMNVVNVRKDKDGVITVATSELRQKDKDDLKSLGISVDGTVEVRLPSNAKVLSHNATGTPGWFRKTYTWKVRAVDERPSIKFQLLPV